MTRGFVLTLACASLATSSASAQGWDDYEGGFNVKLGERGDKFVRLITWAQLWGRVSEMNPGTVVAGDQDEWQSDVGVRRIRLLMFGKPRKDLLFLIHLGIDNQTFRSREAETATPRSTNPFMFLHGAWVEQSLVDEVLSIGAGLHYWGGISRMTNASTLNFMTLDSPIFTWPQIQLSDQFARQLGLYLKGKLGRLDYRVAVNRPFTVATDPESVTVASGARYNPNANTWATAGYFDYELWDEESNTLPYKVGTYLGTKSILNLGAGYYYQPDSMIARDAEGTLAEQAQRIVAVDFFLDTPLDDDSGALSVYAGWFNYDLGDDHLRSVGIMNLGSATEGVSPVNGAGNAYPLIGSGDTFYAQAGYLLPFTLTEDKHQLMPYVASQVSLFDALDDPMGLYEAGLNYFVAGHHAKYTLHYRNRPVYIETARGFTRSASRADELILQAHIWF